MVLLSFVTLIISFIIFSFCYMQLDLSKDQVVYSANQVGLGQGFSHLEPTAEPGPPPKV